MTTEEPAAKDFLRRLYAAALALLAVAALLLRLYRIAERGVWQDEIDLWLGALSDWRSSQMAPLMPWITRGWMRLVGDPASLLSFHLPCVLLGAAGVLPTALLGAELFSPAAGLAAAALLALSPTALFYSQEARPYALLMDLSALIVWSFLRARRDGRAPAWIPFSLFLAAGFLTHLLVAPFAAGLVLWALMEAVRERSARPLGPVLVATLAAAPGLTWVLFRYKAVGSVLLGRYPHPLLSFLREVFVGMGTDSQLGNRSTVVVAGAVVLLVLAALGLWRLRRERTDRAYLLFPFAFVLVVAALYVNLGQMGDWQWTRYLTLLVPFYLVLVAGGALSFRRAGKVLALGLAFVVLLPGLRRWASEETGDRSGPARRFATAIDNADGRLRGVIVIAPEWVPRPIAYASLKFFRNDNRPTFFLQKSGIFEMDQPRVPPGKIHWPERRNSLPPGTYLVFDWRRNWGVTTPVPPNEVAGPLGGQTAVRNDNLSLLLGFDAYDVK